MKATVVLEKWEWPLFNAEPCGFDSVQIDLREPSCSVEVKATISLEDARTLGKRLITLSDILSKQQH